MAKYLNLDEKAERLLDGTLELTDERVHGDLRHLIHYNINPDDIEPAVRFLAAVLYRIVTKVPHGTS